MAVLYKPETEVLYKSLSSLSPGNKNSNTFLSLHFSLKQLHIQNVNIFNNLSLEIKLTSCILIFFSLAHGIPNRKASSEVQSF